MKVVETRSEERSLEFLGDVTLPVTVELGRAEITIRRFLSLRPGSILELDTPQGEPAIIRAGTRPIGRGEIVALNDRYGIRLTAVNDPDEKAIK